MHVNLETLRTHIGYSAWASRRMLDAAAELTPAELAQDFGTADRSVLGTLLHVWGGDLVWIERIDGRSLAARPYTENATLATLQTEWPRTWDRWRNYVDGLTGEAAEASIEYLTFKREPYRTPVWQIILHVVNHATHHRGQAAGFLRTLGKNPPVLDLIAYYRTR